MTHRAAQRRMGHDPTEDPEVTNPVGHARIMTHNLTQDSKKARPVILASLARSGGSDHRLRVLRRHRHRVDWVVVERLDAARQDTELGPEPLRDLLDLAAHPR